MDIFLEVRNVTKRYGDHTALSGVSLSVRRGRIFGLLGPNGAGKTTLLRILNRITAPDSGEVIFDGHEMTEGDTARIGYLPEERGLYRKMKVGEQAVYLAQLKGMHRREAEQRLRKWFSRFDITDWWDRKLEELSKGMAQKVQFIITVLHDPALLIFDEPFSGFDPVNASLLRREILRLRDEGHTVIFSTHNMESVEEICDDIALIDRSRVVLGGKVSEVKERYRTGLYSLITPDTLQMRGDSPYDIVSASEERGLHRYLLSAHPGAAGNDIIRHLIPEVEIRSFAEQIPSINDIFLRVVGRTGKDVTTDKDN